MRAWRGGGATLDLNGEAPLGAASHLPNRASVYVYPELTRAAMRKELTSGAAVSWPSREVLPHVVALLAFDWKFATFEDERSFNALMKKHQHRLQALAVANFHRTVWNKRFPAEPFSKDEWREWPVPTKGQLIHDLRVGHNDRGGKTPFDQLTLGDFVTQISVGWFLWSRDLSGAFKQVPLHSLEPVIAGWAFDRQLAVAVRLPFGARASPYQYGAHLGRPILWLVIR